MAAAQCGFILSSSCILVPTPTSMDLLVVRFTFVFIESRFIDLSLLFHLSGGLLKTLTADLLSVTQDFQILNWVND